MQNIFNLFLALFLLNYSAQAQLSDTPCTPSSNIGILTGTVPADGLVCNDLSNAPIFTLPSSNLPDIEYAIEVNGLITDVNTTALPSVGLVAGDNVCVTAFAYDLAAINEVLIGVNEICAVLDCNSLYDDIPNIEQILIDLELGNNDGEAGLNDLEEALSLVELFGSSAISVQGVSNSLDLINLQLGPLAGFICYASSAPVCYQITTDCPVSTDIPTLSEWGLITLALMLMSYGTIAMAGVGSLAGTNNVNTPIGFQLPMNGAILRKAFMFTIILALVGYTMSIVLFGAIFFSDIIGVAIAGPVFAYLAHLLYLTEKNK